MIIEFPTDDFDPVELAETIQDVLNEELPYLTDGAVPDVQVLYEQPPHSVAAL
jgi:hypothetical protein